MKKLIISLLLVTVLSGCIVVEEYDVPRSQFYVSLEVREDPHSIVPWRSDCRHPAYTRYNTHRRCYYYERHDPRYHYGNCPIVVDRYGRYRLRCQ